MPLSVSLKKKKPIAGCGSGRSHEKDFALDRESLVTSTDSFQYKLCSKLYFEPYPLDRLVDVEYRFEDPALVPRGRRFVDSLRDVEAGLERDGIVRYLDLDSMAPSVQF